MIFFRGFKVVYFYVPENSLRARDLYRILLKLIKLLWLTTVTPEGGTDRLYRSVGKTLSLLSV
jgi:hypothetical protein